MTHRFLKRGGNSSGHKLVEVLKIKVVGAAGKNIGNLKLTPKLGDLPNIKSIVEQLGGSQFKVVAVY